MKKGPLLILAVFFGLAAFFLSLLFFYVSIDIIDGRGRHLKLSPLLHVSTSVGMLIYALIISVLCFISLVLNIKTVWGRNKPEKDEPEITEDEDEKMKKVINSQYDP